MNKLAFVAALALFALPFVAQANEHAADHAAPVDAASAPVAAESAPVAAESAK